MVFSKRQVPIEAWYKPDTTFEFGGDDPVWKITVACTNTVLMEVSEKSPVVFSGTQEIELDKGTHSISFINEVHGIRFRAANISAVVSFRCYGPGA